VNETVSFVRKNERKPERHCLFSQVGDSMSISVPLEIVLNPGCVCALVGGGGREAARRVFLVIVGGRGYGRAQCCSCHVCGGRGVVWWCAVLFLSCVRVTCFACT